MRLEEIADVADGSPERVKVNRTPNSCVTRSRVKREASSTTTVRTPIPSMRSRRAVKHFCRNRWDKWDALVIGRPGVFLVYVAAGAVVAGGAFLHTSIFPERPEVAFFASRLSGVISTAILTMLGRDPF